MRFRAIFGLLGLTGIINFLVSIEEVELVSMRYLLMVMVKVKYKSNNHHDFQKNFNNSNTVQREKSELCHLI